MRRDDPRRRLSRKTTVESLEDRVVMSADPLGGLLGGAIEHQTLADLPPDEYGAPAIEHHQVADSTGQAPDFWLDPSVGDLDQHLYEIEQTLASAHNLTGLTQARADYGFRGTGQTVAVIDSGIAYDHYALGSGFGADFRVVGGWDFTEGDANPYDDGPSGSHGTHVSGIIGGNAASSSDSGVAPGVDLVGLRVFNDSGAGYFSWVEQALQWVHQNRNALENPITAVNLSLGTSWNSESVPSWAMLEDEFAQLENDGIFISVSAGNSFTSYNTTGLSYPAASSHVVPVMSVDDSGLLSYFSQRSQRAIAAPGRYIRSTVPDYAGNHNGLTDDWANFSGTSMAAPYVAGASVLVREAMDFVGYTNITQDTIYDHMIATADRFYDSATGLYYNRLDVAAAIDALIPDDDYGSSIVDAYNLGSISGSVAVSGLIGMLDDVDYFTFTAGVTGTVTMTVTATHNLVPNYQLVGSDAAIEDGTVLFDVAKGQSYTFSLETSAGFGLGYYDVDLTVEQVVVEESPVTVKTLVRNDGAVFSLDSAGWLSVNGGKVWSNTYDFSLGSDGTIYWQSTYGALQRSLRSGGWQTLDHDATKFLVDDGGTVYSLGADSVLKVNGSRAWANTADFGFAPDRTLYWQSTDGFLQHRLSNGTWQNLDDSVTRFAVREDGLVYSVATDGWLRVNGWGNWSGTQDFLLTEDNSLYWQSTNGVLQRLPSGGRWQTIDLGVTEFAVSHDGVAYSLTADGHVTVDGVQTWSNIVSMYTDGNGRLILENASGREYRVEGRFVVSHSAGADPSSTDVQSPSSTEASAQALAALTEGDTGSSVASLVTRPGETARALLSISPTPSPSTRALNSGVTWHQESDALHAAETGTGALWQNIGPDAAAVRDWTAYDLGSLADDVVSDGDGVALTVAVDSLFAQVGNST